MQSEFCVRMRSRWYRKVPSTARSLFYDLSFSFLSFFVFDDRNCVF